MQDIVCIQETWFDASINSEIMIRNTDFLIYRSDRSEFDSIKTSGGGVCTFINKSIYSEQVSIKTIHRKQNHN